MFSKVLALFALTVAATPALAQTATCYDRGNNDAAGCARFVDEFCTTASTIAISSGESTSRCFMANNHRCDFTVYNTGASTKPNANNCKTFLNNAIKRCPTGGKGKVAANVPFSFTVDPNAGNCAADLLPGA